MPAFLRLELFDVHILLNIKDLPEISEASGCRRLLRDSCKLLILNVVARDGIEPPTPAFQGPTNGPKWLRISGCD
jgi:hypothetical protein